MNTGLISITGIVVRQVPKFPNRFYVWCRESYPGRDGIVTADPQKPLKIGDWVDLKFAPSEFQKYFPTPKDPNAEQFRCSNYTLMHKWYDTIVKVDEKSIKVRLELALEENQREIRHEIFGTIYNNRNMSFEASDYLVTIKRIAPLPYMESVWVIESVDSLPSEISLIGIVAGSDNNFWYVWTKERPVGRDVTIKRGGANLNLGSWVGVTVPRDKLKSDYFLESQKYTVIPEIHPTTVISKTISLTLQCNVSSGNSTVIQHPFVGPIINENTEIPRDGLYRMKIVRKKPKMMRNGEKSVWFLDGEPEFLLASSSVVPPRVPQRVEQPQNIPAVPQNRAPQTFELTGIIVAKNTTHLFVWCKERRPGFDVKIPKSENSASLDLTDFVKFTVSDEQKSRFFRQEMPENGHYPDFELAQYRKIPKNPQFDTFTTGINNTVNMELEVEIQNPTSGDISHDFVGLIINKENKSFETGKYKITINRYKKGDAPKSVWYLKNRELISNLSTSTQSLAVSMENLNLEPKPHNAPEPSPQRVRQDSQSRNPPIPAPRRSLERNRPQSASNYSEAIILNIVKKVGSKEDIHVWIFNKLKQGFLNLSVPAETLNLEIGSVFGAEFVEKNGKYKAFEVQKRRCEKFYSTRTRINGEIEISVDGKIRAAHPSQGYQTIEVVNFGVVHDVYGRIVSDFDTRESFWIKRYKIDSNRWEWIFVEVVDPNQNNSNCGRLLPV